MLLDDSVTMYNLMKEANVESKLEIFDEVFHGWQLGYPALPEANLSIEKTAKYIEAYLKWGN